MCNISLSFRIAVDAEKSDIIKLLKTNFNDFYKEESSERDFVLNNNYVKIMQNEDYNILLANGKDESYLYYKYNLDFYPNSENILLDYQIEISKKIKELFTKRKIKSEIISEFEHLL